MLRAAATIFRNKCYRMKNNVITMDGPFEIHEDKYLTRQLLQVNEQGLQICKVDMIFSNKNEKRFNFDDKFTINCINKSMS